MDVYVGAFVECTTHFVSHDYEERECSKCKVGGYFEEKFCPKCGTQIDTVIKTSPADIPASRVTGVEESMGEEMTHLASVGTGSDLIHIWIPNKRRKHDGIIGQVVPGDWREKKDFVYLTDLGYEVQQAAMHGLQEDFAEELRILEEHYDQVLIKWGVFNWDW